MKAIINPFLTTATACLCFFLGCEKKNIPFNKSLDISGGWNYEKYLDVAENCANTLLERGIDNFGRVETPIFLSNIQINGRQNAREKSHDSEWFKANLYDDFSTLNAFYKLSNITQNSKYRLAADNYISYYLNHLVNQKTGLIAYGKHIYYNAYTDVLENNIHELGDGLPLLNEMWRISPNIMRAYTDAIFAAHYQKRLPFEFHQSASIDSGFIVSNEMRSSIKDAALFINIFLYGFLKTHETKYLTWARNTILLFERKKNPETRLVPDILQEPGNGEARLLPLAALYLIRASEILRNDLLNNIGLEYLKKFTQFAYNAENQMFRNSVQIKKGVPTNNEYQTVWSGDGMAIFSGRACIQAYVFSGDKVFLDRALKYASFILNSKTCPDAPPRNSGMAIRFFLEMYQATNINHFLNEARKLAQQAIETYIENGLIKMCPEVSQYRASSGAGELLLAIVNLYEIESQIDFHWSAPQMVPGGIREIPVNLKLNTLLPVSVGYVLGIAPPETLNFSDNIVKSLKFTIPVADTSYRGNLYYYFITPKAQLAPMNGQVSIVSPEIGAEKNN